MRLYDHWLRTVAQQPREIGLADAATGEQFSFRQLHELAENRPAAPPVVFASGRGTGFFLDVLTAWRDGAVLCPLDAEPPSETPPPDLLAARGIRHIKLTSGSTGAARQVLFREEQLLADCENICATMGLRPEVPNVGVISLAHSYGFSNLVLPLLLKGIPLILAPDALPASLQKALAPGRPVALPAVPAMWRAWRNGGLLRSGISLAISAGAPLTLELEQNIFDSCGLKVHNFYGASECGGIAYDRTSVPRTAADIAGTAMEKVSHELADDGRLAVRSAAVGEMLWPPAAGDGETLGGGRFLTSDLAELAGGVLRLTGRAGDVINVAGRKVNPAEIEEILLREPGVQHAVVFGIPSRDAERCDDIVAVVALTDGVSLAEVRRAAGAALPAWKLPRHWWECAGLQADHRGKTPRSSWKARFLAEKS